MDADGAPRRGGGDMPQLFISHAEEDEAIAVEIAGELEKRGFGVWHYKRDTTAGLTYVQQVMEAVKKCECVILIVSKSSMDSHEVDTEVINAYRAKKRFVPVLSGVSHEEFGERRPQWDYVTAAAVSIALPPEGVPAIVDELETGVRGLGIEPEAKPVTCSAYAPRECVAGAPYLVQIWLHDPARAEEVGRMAAEFDSDARPASKLTLKAVRRGASLRFGLEAADIPVASWDTEERAWDGRTESVNFLINAPEESRGVSVVGRVRVSQEQVPVGSLSFMVKIKGGAQTEEEPPAPAPAETLVRYKSAYLCYAYKDRAQVLVRAQALFSAGVSVFMDRSTLRPGDDWQSQVCRMIDQADAFFLFWSKDAAQSGEVRKEVLYALEHQKHDAHGLPTIIPVVLGVPAPPPPPELAHLHFDSEFSYLIGAEEALKKQGKKSPGKSPKKR